MLQHSGTHLGVMTPLWIPQGAQGTFDGSLVAEHLRWMESQEVSSYLALGTTSEFPLIEPAVRVHYLHFLSTLNLKKPVWVNVSHLEFSQAKTLAQTTKNLGFAGVTLLPPWYYRLHDDEIFEFTLRALGDLDFPVMLYEFPERTGNSFSLENIEKLASRLRIHGIKYSGSDWSRHRDLVALGRERHFRVLTGNDQRQAEARSLGVDGVVSGYSNFMPEWMVECWNDAVEGAEKDSAMHVRTVGSLLAELPFALNVIAGMEARNIPPGTMRQAYGAASQLKHRIIRDKLTTYFATHGFKPAITKSRLA